jgi:hypothetical protein
VGARLGFPRRVKGVTKQSANTIRMVRKKLKNLRNNELLMKCLVVIVSNS